jgi:hypothetical protein
VTVDAAQIAQAKAFLDTMVGELDLRTVMAANYAKNYADKAQASEEVNKMMVFDGDYFRYVADPTRTFVFKHRCNMTVTLL